MGKLKNVAQDWLEDYGYSLGYDWENLPKSVNWKDIKLNNINSKIHVSNTKSHLSEATLINKLETLGQ